MILLFWKRHWNSGVCHFKLWFSYFENAIETAAFAALKCGHGKPKQIWKIRKRVILWVNFDAQRQTVGHPPGFPKNAKFDRERRSLRAFLRRGYKKTKIKNTMSCLCLLLSMFFKKWKKPHLLKTKNKMSCLCLLLSMFFDKEKNLHP